MQIWARIQDKVVAEVTDSDPAGRFHPSLDWVVAPFGTKPGMTYDGVAFANPLPPAASSGPRAVPLSTIRERLQAAGKWEAFAATLDTLAPGRRWHLLTLGQGVPSDDADLLALLDAVGADAATVLA